MPHQPRRHRVWSRPVAVIADALRTDPRRTLALLRGMNPLDKNELRRLSLAVHGRTLLADLQAAAAESRTRPFLMWGTLLGAVREGGLLAHDRDVDIGLLPADYAARDRLIGALLARGYLYVDDWRYKFRLLRRDHLLHVDFDLLYPAGDRVVCLAGKVPGGGHYGASFPADAIGTPRPLTILGGLDVLVPERPEAVLEAIYGPDWRAPDPAYDSSTDLHNRLRFGPEEAIPLPPEEAERAAPER